MKVEAMICSGNVLESMDEILPLFIIAMIRSRIEKPNLLANLLLDWMNQEQKAESEGQIVAMFQSAAMVIAQEKDLMRFNTPKSSPQSSPVDHSLAERL